MNKPNNISLVLATLAVAMVSGEDAAAAPDGGKVKCYGIAQVGKNDCASATGAHSCAGQTKANKQPDDWVYVANGTCEKQGGKTTPPAAK